MLSCRLLGAPSVCCHLCFCSADHNFPPAAALALEYLAAIATNGDQLAVMHFLLIILMLWLMDSFVCVGACLSIIILILGTLLCC